MDSQNKTQTLSEAQERIKELEATINAMDELVRGHFGDVMIDGICYDYVSEAVEAGN